MRPLFLCTKGEFLMQVWLYIYIYVCVWVYIPVWIYYVCVYVYMYVYQVQMYEEGVVVNLKRKFCLPLVCRLKLFFNVSIYKTEDVE